MAIKKAAIALLILPILSGPACGMKRMATSVLGKVASDGMVALEGEEDVAFARESAPALIKTLEVFSYGDARDARSLLLLSQSYAQYAFGFLEEEMLALQGDAAGRARAASQASLFYRRGRGFGMRALASSNPAMGRALDSPFPEFKQALAGLGKRAAPALFWTAFNWASHLNLNLNDPEAIAELPRIEAMVDRAIELDSAYRFGSLHSLKGVIAAMRPKMFGGDLALAEREFRTAMELSPDYLMTKVIFAQYYARQAQDPALFRAALSEVEAADASRLPEQRLANELAKRRAKILLGMEKKLF